MDQPEWAAPEQPPAEPSPPAPPFGAPWQATQLPPPPPDPGSRIRKRTIVLASAVGVFGLLALVGITVTVGTSVADEEAGAEEYAEFVCREMEGVVEEESNAISGMYPNARAASPSEALISISRGLEELDGALEGYARVAADAPVRTDAAREAREGLQEMSRIGREVNESMRLGLDSLVSVSSMAAFDPRLHELMNASFRPHEEDFQRAAEQAEGEGAVGRALDRECLDLWRDDGEGPASAAGDTVPAR